MPTPRRSQHQLLLTHGLLRVLTRHSGYIHRHKCMTAREVADYKLKLREQTQTLMQAGEQLQEEWERTHANVRRP